MPLTPLEATRPTAYRTKQEMVYHAMREAILTCELVPDQRLVIEDLARRLNVSAIPVREALQMLQSEGLVTMVPHVGAAVASLSRESVVDVFSVLEGLQVVAGRLATSQATPDAIRGLSEMVAAMDDAIAQGEYEQWAELNTRFHAEIGALPGLALLRQGNDQALDRWDRTRRFFFNGVLVPRVEQAQREHRELMAAFEAREPARVASVMRAHYEGALAAYLHYFDEKGTG